MFDELDTNCNPSSNAKQTVKNGPKYFVCIEGQEHPWPDNTITYEEIVDTGGWEISQGVIEIDRDNNERTLQPGEIVEIKPGHGFSKKICWKRGLTKANERMEQELALLRNNYPDLKYEPDGQWVLVPAYASVKGWSLAKPDIAFQIPLTGYPGTPPYGFYVPVGFRFTDQMPNNYQEPAKQQPPFGGQWGIFSWSPENNQWKPTADISAGANLLNWAQSFATRFRQGL